MLVNAGRYLLRYDRALITLVRLDRRHIGVGDFLNIRPALLVGYLDHESEAALRGYVRVADHDCERVAGLRRGNRKRGIGVQNPFIATFAEVSANAEAELELITDTAPIAL